ARPYDGQWPPERLSARCPLRHARPAPAGTARGAASTQVGRTGSLRTPMKPASESRARPEALSRRRILLLAAFLASAVGIPAALIAWRRAPERSRRLDLDTGSPYRNTRAGVEYVGDAACARCHTEIAETYRRHPMGRSLAPIDGTT